jgi:CheY-like chemotaxis protein
MPDGGKITINAENRVLDAARIAKIEGGRTGNFLKVEVRDNGIGIPPEVIGRIFEPFFTTKGEDKGTGLGLSTVRSIVRQHDGFITVDSSTKEGRGRGTTFTVYLPVTVGEAADPSVTPGDIPLRGRGEVILFVDDEAPVREIGTKILVDNGYRVITAVDGADAVVAFVPRASEVRLLIADLDMPRVSGPQLALALRAISPALPVIAMSGTAKQSEESLKGFTNAFLPKPFQTTTLLKIVRRVLDKAGSSAPFLPKT